MDTSEVLEISGRLTVKKLPEVSYNTPGSSQGHGQGYDQGINWKKNYYFVIADSTGKFYKSQQKYKSGSPFFNFLPPGNPFAGNWETSGNIIGVNDFLGSNSGNSLPLVIKINGVEQMSVSTTGVGIGYANPGTAKLAVNGKVGILTTSPKTTFDIRGHLNIQNGNNAAVIYFPNTGNLPNLYFRSDDDPGTYDPASERLFIGGNGKIGIGTTNPDTRLHIKAPNSNIMMGITQSHFVTGNNNGGAIYLGDGFGGTDMTCGIESSWGGIGAGSGVNIPQMGIGLIRGGRWASYPYGSARRRLWRGYHVFQKRN